MPGKLEGKRAIVTGASSGIGAAITRRFSAEGASIWAAGGFNQERLDGIIADCGAGGGKIDGRCYDLRDARKANDVMSDGAQFLGGLDIMVNCAAMRGHKSFLEFTDEEIDDLYEVNAKSVFIATREAARLMAPQGTGKILMIGSIDGERGVPGNALYCATKTSMHNLTRALAVELGPLGLRVNCLMPGTTESERVKEIHINDPVRARAKLPRIPVNRFATPEEMAEVSLFMVSNENDFMNGAFISCDGGTLAM